MNLPPRFGADLWRRLAAAQDAAVVDPQTWRALEHAVSVRIAAADQGTRRRGSQSATAVASSRAFRPARRLSSVRNLRTLAGLLGASLVLSAAVAVLVNVMILHRPASGLQLLNPVVTNGAAAGPHKAEERVGRAFVAGAGSDLPLRFTDGSTVTFRAGAAGRMQRLTGTGAEIVLERGWLEAHVVHADTTLWLVHAGPYRVRVTGTRFAMTWAATSFELDLFEGAVVIDGAVLGAGVPLRAGQRLRIDSGVVLIEPLASEGRATASLPGDDVPVRPDQHTGAAVAPQTGDGAPAAVESAPSGEAAVGGGVVRRHVRAAAGHRHGQRIASTGHRDGKSHRKGNGSVHGRAGRDGERVAATMGGVSDRLDNEWLLLAERGEYRAAFSAAQRSGWSALCHRLDARRLLTLGDVARYSGAHVQARQAFQSVVTRFPDDRLAADAVFSLGRLAFESSRPGEATRWFGRYVADWPDAPLADQATGRLLECALRVDDRSAAQSAARRYLARAPRGPHATLAREVLAQPSSVSPSVAAPSVSPPRSALRLDHGRL